MTEPTRATTVLVVEDDEDLRVTLVDNLQDEGYGVSAASTLASGRAQALDADPPFDVIILDIMLPDGDGYSLARRLRQAPVPSRILMLTARSLEDDLVRGFDSGADDYLVKPYRLRELLARVAALARRAPQADVSAGDDPGGPCEIGAFRFDPDAREVTDSSGAPVELTRTEFDLLAHLLAHRGRALRRPDLLDAVWGTDVIVDPRTVDNFVHQLKRKLDLGSPGAPFAIETVRGVGYRLSVRT